MNDFTCDERGLYVEDGLCRCMDFDRNTRYFESLYGPQNPKGIIFPEDVKKVGHIDYIPVSHLSVIEVSDNIEGFNPYVFASLESVSDFRVKDHITGEYILHKEFVAGAGKTLNDYKKWCDFVADPTDAIWRAKNTKPKKAKEPVSRSANNVAGDPLLKFVADHYSESSIPDSIRKLKVDKVHSKAGSIECATDAVRYILSEYFKVWEKVSTVYYGALGDTRVLENDLNSIDVVPNAEAAFDLINKEEFIDYLKSRIEGNFYRLVLIPFIRYASDSDIAALKNTIATKKKGNAKDKLWAQTMSHAIAGRLNKEPEVQFSGEDSQKFRQIVASLDGCTITDKQRNSLRKNIKALGIEYELDDVAKTYDYGTNRYIFSNENTMHLGKCVDIEYVSDSVNKTLELVKVRIVNEKATALSKVIGELEKLL